IIRRVDVLYDAYKTYPHLSAKLGHEIEGDEFGVEHDRIPTPIFQRTFFQCQRTDINISTYVEYRARLALLKSAVDFALYENAGFEDRVKEEIEILGLTLSLKDSLPSSFLDGLDR